MLYRQLFHCIVISNPQLILGFFLLKLLKQVNNKEMVLLLWI